MKKNDWIIIGIVIFIAVSAYIWNIIIEKNEQYNVRYVEIYTDGELYERVNIQEQKTVVIETELGRNVIEIKDGNVTMIEADCPDKICLETGTINRTNRSIVCLPNKVHIQIKGDMEDDIDAIVQ